MDQGGAANRQPKLFIIRIAAEDRVQPGALDEKTGFGGVSVGAGPDDAGAAGTAVMGEFDHVAGGPAGLGMAGAEAVVADIGEFTGDGWRAVGLEADGSEVGAAESAAPVCAGQGGAALGAGVTVVGGHQ